jgi:ABC-type Zn uptake system ZnuABC Zn-binding protein ZnuA
MARSSTLTAAAGLAALLAACGGATTDRAEDPGAGSSSEQLTSDDDGDVAAEDGAEPPAEATSPDSVPEVVATVAPIADLVSVVGGDRIAVTSLVPAGADAHTYEPRPQDVVSLSEADAYIGVGLELNEGALRLARENLPGDAPLVRLGEQMLEDQDLVFDHSHEEGGDHGHSHEEDDGHGHSHDDGELGPNPHVWTSVRNAATMVDGVAETLTELDPDGAQHYAANAAAYRGELAELDEQIAEATATIPSDDRVLVTYHDAWTYFARDYDLTFATALQPADFSEPSAGELRALIDQIRDLGVPTVFGSEVFPTPVLEAIAEETDATYVGDLADDVLPGEPGDPEHSYLELMRRNARTIVSGLGGDPSALD